MFYSLNLNFMLLDLLLTPFKSSKIPVNTGVYIYRNNESEVLYCGKAKNLRNRIKSYFSNSESLSTKTYQLIKNTRFIDWIIVDNEVEALLLENRLIKQHQPKYNVLLKDAKTFSYLALTKERFPRLCVTRKPNAKLDTFGAYTNTHLRRELQMLVMQIFKLRDCKNLPKKACLNFYINRCSAPCIHAISEIDYSHNVEKAKKLLSGNIKEVVAFLTEKMHIAATEQKFEQALAIRNQLTRLEQLNQKQIVDLHSQRNQDVIAFWRYQEIMRVLYFQVKKGVLSGKKDFSLDYQDNVEQEFLKAFYREQTIPHEIIVNQKIWHDEAEKKALEIFFSKNRGANVTLILPERGDKLALIKLAEKNIEVNLDVNNALIDLQNQLNLKNLPKLIECFDISNLGNEHIVAGMTQFINAKPNKKAFRHFLIQTTTHANDFASMKEAVYRRYFSLKTKNQPFPDLIIVDGGIVQVNAANEALMLLNLNLPLIGLAKKQEEIYFPDFSTPRQFSKNCSMMLLLRKIRDATHDYSVNFNRHKRKKRMLNS